MGHRLRGPWVFAFAFFPLPYLSGALAGCGSPAAVADHAQLDITATEPAGFAMTRNPNVYLASSDGRARVGDDVFAAVGACFQADARAEGQNARVCGDDAFGDAHTAGGSSGQTVCGGDVSLRGRDRLSRRGREGHSFRRDVC